MRVSCDESKHIRLERTTIGVGYGVSVACASNATPPGAMYDALGSGFGEAG